MSPKNSKTREPREEDHLKALGMRVRKWREQKGLTQEQFAPVVGFTRSYITEIETGKRNISFLNLIKLLETLEVDDREVKQLLHDIYAEKEK
ncbi:MAG: XRE family transcriptional regulator [Anaerolineae bacterium CG03_land_8_20_14_0_80_58_20]|nr:MAG: hypothetical protein AUJ21_03640 [Anaerolineae bacterium CG1_02_58_13]PIV27650.1 MAG: XRE family transcriptional regulator [Anaerolineae bacterium CG03_land_8_20_14_0_80_58_20]